MPPSWAAPTTPSGPTFAGEANRRTVKTLAQQTIDVAEPYMGITPESRFDLTANGDLPGDLTLDRLDSRRSLMEQFERARQRPGRSDPGRSVDRYRAMAYNLIGSDRIAPGPGPGPRSRCRCANPMA